MAVSKAQRQRYYDRVLDGTASRQRERIMRFMLKYGEPITRHQLADIFKPIFPGTPTAFDGGKVIPLQSVCSAVSSLFGIDDNGKTKKDDPDYIRVSHLGDDPITGSKDVEFLVPIGDEWAQRRMFDDFA